MEAFRHQGTTTHHPIGPISLHLPTSRWYIALFEYLEQKGMHDEINEVANSLRTDITSRLQTLELLFDYTRSCQTQSVTPRHEFWEYEHQRLGRRSNETSELFDRLSAALQPYLGGTRVESSDLWQSHHSCLSNLSSLLRLRTLSLVISSHIPSLTS